MFTHPFMHEDNTKIKYGRINSTKVINIDTLDANSKKIAGFGDSITYAAWNSIPFKDALRSIEVYT